jgi:hypothetical protein
MVSRFRSTLYALESWAVKIGIVLLLYQAKIMYCSIGASFNGLVARLDNYTVDGYVFPMFFEVSLAV